MTNQEFSGLLNELASSGASAQKTMDFFRTHIDDLSLERLNQLIDTVSVKMNSNGSVVDFPTEMVTCLYSGYMEDVRTQDYVSKMSDVRILDNTHAAEFLNKKEFKDLLKKLFEKEIASGKINENNVSEIQNGIRFQEDKDELLRIMRKISDDRDSVTNADILQAAKIAANGYEYEPSKGAWAIISENFVKVTSPNSEIICITPEADLGRTWALVEIPTMLDKCKRQVLGHPNTCRLLTTGYFINTF